ncbi:MAG: hypothetical protein GY755_22595, partial [Chloroflexi bacterium]|nr:hypothetical protein [Chloroflexota bacterium]
TLQERYIIINDCESDYKKSKTLMCNTLINNNEWTPYDIRHIKHLKYDQKESLLQKYIDKQNIKINKYIKMKNSIFLYNKKWWLENKLTPINGYITYQKTIINENMLYKIIFESKDVLLPEIKEIIDMNIYFRYQKTLYDFIKTKK